MSICEVSQNIHIAIFQKNLKKSSITEHENLSSSVNLTLLYILFRNSSRKTKSG